MRWLIRSIITILVLIPFLVHLFSIQGFDFLNRMEFWAYDTRMSLTMPNTKDEDVVIIDIDEKSMSEFGQWPWPRDVLAEMVDVLFEHYQISVLGFDMQFPEADRDDDLDLIDELETTHAGDVVLEKLNLREIREQRNRDKRFAESIRNRAVVLGFTLNDDNYQVGALPQAIIDLDKSPEYANFPFIPLSGHIGNLSILQGSEVRAGNFNPLTIDTDGKIRGIAMLSKKDNKVYESLSLAVARRALGAENITFANDSYNSEDVTAENFSAIVMSGTEYFIGDDMEMLIPYRGQEGTFDYFSAADIINKKISKARLSNVIALVGSRASGLRDLRVAPMAENFPGVEMNANMVSGIMLNTVKHTPESAYLMELCILLLLAILFTALLPRLPVLNGGLLTALVLVLLWFSNLYLWNTQNEVQPITISLLFSALLFFAHTIYGSFIESRNKQQLTKLFGQYVPPELVNEMEADLTHYSMETKQAELTVMFADIKGFTTLSEALNAEQVAQVLNEFLTTMTEVIHNKRGTIDKYMGDAIMAFWGAPLDDEKHAQHAVETAFLMQEKMHALNVKLHNRGLPNIDICIGINTGNMSVGNMGSEFRMAYTVIGDSVNLAARLEALTRTYGVGVMMGENTRRVIKDTLCLELDKVIVKGKQQAVSIYEPLGLISNMSQEQATMLEKQSQALLAYREKNWPVAIRIFQELKEQFPEKHLFEVFLQRLENFRENPPLEAWDGAHKFTQK